MSTLSADDRASLLEFLAAELGGRVEPDLLLPAECSLSRGVLAFVGELVIFASQRFGRWEIQEKFPLSSASQVEAGPAFSGGGYQLRLMVGGRMLRFGELDEGMARAAVRILGASAGASVKAAGPSLPPRRPAASLASTHMPASPLFAGLAAGGASAVGEHGAIGAGFLDTSRAASWAADHPALDDEVDDAYEQLEAADLIEVPSTVEERRRRAAALAAAKAAAEKQAPTSSIGAALARAFFAGVLTSVIWAGWREAHVPPFDGDFYPPPFYAIVYWLTMAWGGSLVCGKPGRIFSVSFWAIFAGIASWILFDEAGLPEAAPMAGLTLLGWGYMRARSAENGLVKALGIALVVRVIDSGMDVSGADIGGGAQITFSFSFFWLLHFLWERADSGKPAKGTPQARP